MVEFDDDEDEYGGESYDGYGDDRVSGPKARGSDPESSHEGAADAQQRAGAQREMIEDAFYKAYPGWLNAHEAILAAGLDHRGNSCHTRVSELHDAGVLYRSWEKRPSPITNKQQQILRWVPPPERLSPDELAKRKQTELPTEMAQALTTVGEVRDQLLVIAKRGAEAAQVLADQLTGALALAPRFHDWHQGGAS